MMHSKTPAIAKGDKTPCGGEVLEGCPTFKVGDKNPSLEGDLVWCKEHQKTFSLTGGRPSFTYGNRMVAVLHDSRVTCPDRCPIVDNQIPHTALSHGGTGQTFSQHGVTDGASTTPRSTRPGGNQHFQIVDQEGKPVSGIVVRVRSTDGELKEITTDSQGKTPVLPGQAGEYIDLFLNHGRK